MQYTVRLNCNRRKIRDEIFDVPCNSFFCFLLFVFFFRSEASLFILCSLNGQKIDDVRYSGDIDDIISMARGNGLEISVHGGVWWEPTEGLMGHKNNAVHRNCNIKMTEDDGSWSCCVEDTRTPTHCCGSWPTRGRNI